EGRVMEPARRRPPVLGRAVRPRVDVVAEEDQVDVAETHVRAAPALGHGGRALDGLERAGRRARIGGREVRLASEGGRPARGGEERGERGADVLLREVDAVRVDAVARGVAAGENGGAR